MTRPPSHLKLLANRLARAARSPSGTHVIRQLQLAGLFQRGERPQPQPESEPSQPDGVLPERIGVWEPRSEGGQLSFVRAADAREEWLMWANVPRIGPKQTQWRVVLLGESVARGQLYEPSYTPALVLQTLLERVLGKRSIEVVDLARTGMSTEIGELAIRAAALDPDAIVVFAGNNWRPPDFMTQHWLLELDAVLRTEGVAGLKLFAENQLRAVATALVQKIRDYYTARRTPVLWVIPEFNLGDWRDWRVNAPHLHGTANSEWLTCCESAERALAREDFVTAQALGLRMLELDQWTNSYSLAILAECRMRSGDIVAARTYLESARDARIWDWSQPLPPRCLAVTRRVLQEHASRDTSSVLELPDLFQEYLAGALPDRRLFLDFCHLTSEGIRLAMATVASGLVKALTQRETGWRVLLPNAPHPDTVVGAEAALLAAVHCAHWWQPQPVIEHHCSQALALSPHVADLMTSFMELQTTPTPAPLSRPAERLLGHGRQAPQYLLGYSVQRLDAVLLDSMACALEREGRPVRSTLMSYWLGNHDVAERQADLLAFYYLSSAGQPQELFWAMPPDKRVSRFTGPDYYRANWVESTFVFVASGRHPVLLDLTCRIPGARSDAEKFNVVVNDVRIAHLAAGRSWSRYRVLVEPQVQHPGINSIRIRWPQFNVDQRDELIAAADALPNVPPPLFHTFGEIHAFTASPA